MPRGRSNRKTNNNNNNNNNITDQPMNTTGIDSNGRVYNSIDELWSTEFRVNNTNDNNNTSTATTSSTSTSTTTVDKSRWYNDGARYWSNVDDSIDGMLGGLSHVSPTDIQESKQFIQSLNNIQYNTALDCGGGIGRVSKLLLCDLFNIVDMVEQNAQYVNTATRYIDKPNIRNLITCGLQDYTPEHNTYNIIWIQWVSSHLDDNDYIAFLKRCKQSLIDSNSYICIKENCVKNVLFHVDRDDSSITRSDNLFKDIFYKAGLNIVKQQQQVNWPKGLFPVMMYALQ